MRQHCGMGEFAAEEKENFDQRKQFTTKTDPTGSLSPFKPGKGVRSGFS
jgi:hypothetical protein